MVYDEMQLLNKRVVKPIDIEYPDRFSIEPDGIPSKDFSKFFNGTDSTGKC